MADPFRHLADGLASLANPVGTPGDKLRVGLLRLRSLLASGEGLLAAEEETTTLERLRVGGWVGWWCRLSCCCCCCCSSSLSHAGCVWCCCECDVMVLFCALLVLVM